MEPSAYGHSQFQPSNTSSRARTRISARLLFDRSFFNWKCAPRSMTMDLSNGMAVSILLYTRVTSECSARYNLFKARIFFVQLQYTVSTVLYQREVNFNSSQRQILPGILSEFLGFPRDILNFISDPTPSKFSKNYINLWAQYSTLSRVQCDQLQLSVKTKFCLHLWSTRWKIKYMKMINTKCAEIINSL